MGCWLRKGCVSGETGPAEWGFKCGGAGDEEFPVLFISRRGWLNCGRVSKLLSSSWEDASGATGGGAMKASGDG